MIILIDSSIFSNGLKYNSIIFIYYFINNMIVKNYRIELLFIIVNKRTRRSMIVKTIQYLAWLIVIVNKRPRRSMIVKTIQYLAWLIVIVNKTDAAQHDCQNNP